MYVLEIQKCRYFLEKNSKLINFEFERFAQNDENGKYTTNRLGLRRLTSGDSTISSINKSI